MASSVPNNEATQFKSGENAVENGRKGGIASGVAKREKKTMIETLKALLDETNPKTGLTYREMATYGLLKGASKGNANNYKVILEAVGELTPEMQQAKEPSITINMVDNSNLESEFKDEKDS